MALSDTKSIVPRADQQGTLGTATKSWGQLFIENPTDGGAAGVTISNLDVDKIALYINANNTTANVLDITAGALTTGNLVQLTSNDALTGTANKEIILIDSNKSGVTGDGIANTTTGIAIDLYDSATNHTGALVTQTALKLDVDSANAAGTISNIGIDLDIAGADSNHGIHVTVPAADSTNNFHFKAASSLDSGDFFSIYTDAHGATTLKTVDDDAAAGHLTFAVDGDIKFGGTYTAGGSARAGVDFSANYGYSLNPACSDIFQLNGTGDYIQLYGIAYGSSGLIFSGTTNGCYFGAYKIIE